MKKLVFIEGPSGSGKSHQTRKLRNLGYTCFFESLEKFHNECPNLELREKLITWHKFGQLGQAVSDLSKLQDGSAIFIDQSPEGFISWLNFGEIQGFYTKDFSDRHRKYVEMNAHDVFNVIENIGGIKVYWIRLKMLLPEVDRLSLLKTRISSDGLEYHDEEAIELWKWANTFYEDVDSAHKKMIIDKGFKMPSQIETIEITSLSQNIPQQIVDIIKN